MITSTRTSVHAIARIGWWLLATACGALLFLELQRRGALPAYTVSSCVFRRLSGVPCPACGLTRSFFAMAMGQWHEAFVMHPLGPFLALECAAIWGVWGAWAAGWRPPFKQERIERWSERLIVINAALFVVVWSGRLYFHTLP